MTSFRKCKKEHTQMNYIKTNLISDRTSGLMYEDFTDDVQW